MANARDKSKFKSTNIAMLITHGFNNVDSIFVGTFLISYIYSLSSNYMLDIGLFYVFMYFTMLVFYVLISKIIDKTDRVTFYRLALVVKGVFILCVILLGKNLAKVVILAGALYGFAEACYWTSYNLMKNELVSHHAMEKYSLFQSIDTKAINIILPLVLGKIIDGESFKVCSIIVLTMVCIQIIVSFFIKSKRPENSSFNFKEFVTNCKNLEPEKRKIVKNSLLISILYGMGGVIAPLNTIIIMISFGSNFSLGIISSVFAVFSMLLLLCYKKWTKIGNRRVIYLISAVLPMIASVLVLCNLNKYTVVFYVLMYTISVILYDFSFDVTRNLILKKLGMYDSIAEYQCGVEAALEIGRVVVYGIMAIFGALTMNLSHELLQTSVKIFCGVAIFIISLLNIFISVYEKKFKEHIIDEK